MADRFRLGIFRHLPDGHGSPNQGRQPAGEGPSEKQSAPADIEKVVDHVVDILRQTRIVRIWKKLEDDIARLSRTGSVRQGSEGLFRLDRPSRWPLAFFVGIELRSRPRSALFLWDSRPNHKVGQYSRPSASPSEARRTTTYLRPSQM